MWELLRDDPEVNADWDMSNFIAVSRLKFNDHGEVHAKIVAANALRVPKLLFDNGEHGEGKGGHRGRRVPGRACNGPAP